MDLSQIPPETLQQLMQMTGAKTPDELLMLAQANPQAALDMIGGMMGAVNGMESVDKQNPQWMDQAASGLAAPGARPMQSYSSKVPLKPDGTPDYGAHARQNKTGRMPPDDAFPPEEDEAGTETIDRNYY